MLVKNVAELSFPEIDWEFIIDPQFLSFFFFFLRPVNEMNVEMYNLSKGINSKHLKYICIYLYIYSFKEVKCLVSLWFFFFFLQIKL